MVGGRFFGLVTLFLSRANLRFGNIDHQPMFLHHTMLQLIRNMSIYNVFPKEPLVTCCWCACNMAQRSAGEAVRTGRIGFSLTIVLIVTVPHKALSILSIHLFAIVDCFCFLCCHEFPLSLALILHSFASLDD